MPSIDKVLIANRGEIAVRILRTCRELGLRSVAVYSAADEAALHTRLADECYPVGPPAAAESYLQQDKIIAVARQCGADAIHPGYGFLAENPEFAARVAEAGLIFIGPPPGAMRMMGDKTAARKAMQEAGVPTVPGTAEPLANAEAAKKAAAGIGYPVLLKAAAGGGGKGMRIVHTPAEIASSFRAAASEAQSAFGDDRVYLEKYLQQPRHIEFQILADTHGNAIHLGERECSIQRRHQKVIEEAPATIVDAAMREAMGNAAVKATLACGYVNAGTIEFLVDRERNFYFLEMNTRLQVEHPVTEQITRLDLVKLQLEIAAGRKLPLTQEQVKADGHAIECRIYAEDPLNNFMPSAGRISYLHKPDGPGIRDDSGVTAGDEISLYYDPMIAKLVAWGENRPHAIARMRRALFEYRIQGVMTTIPFCAWVLQHPRFRSGDFDTHFIQEEFQNGMTRSEEALTEAEMRAAAIAAAFHLQEQEKHYVAPVDGATLSAGGSAWRARGWKYQKR